MRRYLNKSLIPLLLLMILLAACGEATGTVGPAAQPTAAPGNTATIVPTATIPPALTATPIPNQQITRTPKPTTPTAVPITSTTVAASPKATQTPGTPAAVSLGQSFQLKINQSAVLAESGLTITFSSISEESRCPNSDGNRGVACFWAGQVSAQLEVKQGNNRAESIKLTLPGATSLTTIPASATKKLGNQQLQLLKVAPHPVIDQTLDPADYEITLQVTNL